VRGEIADRVKLWTVELLLPAGERLPEGVKVGVSARTAHRSLDSSSILSAPSCRTSSGKRCSRPFSAVPRPSGSALTAPPP
jgi:hypothetical protein